MKADKLYYKSLSKANWTDFEQLMGEKGGCGGCWCMWWKLKRSIFEKQKGGENKLAIKQIVDKGKELGVIAYLQEEPVAWCAIAPRASYPVLERSRVLKKVDEQEVWSVTCFFVAKPYRKQGIATKLLSFAIAHGAERKAKIIEGYPIAPKKDKTPDAFLWTGLGSSYLKAGFKEVARRSATRPIMRYEITEK